MSREALAARMEQITRYDHLANAQDVARMSDTEFEMAVTTAKQTFGGR